MTRNAHDGESAPARPTSTDVYPQIIPGLLETCEAIHPGCAVVLIGSVGLGTQVVGSDLDLNLIFPGDDGPAVEHPYIGDDNRWQLVVKDHIADVPIDIAWETERVLLERVSGDEVKACWPFSNGRVLRDPLNIVGPALTIVRRWFEDHPDVREQIERSYAENKRRQREARGKASD